MAKPWPVNSWLLWRASFAGLPVLLLETQPAALERGRALIEHTYAAQVAQGKLTAAQHAQRMALLSGTLDYADLDQADLVIKAVFEDLEVKEAVFCQLDAVCKPGAILASNTSTLESIRSPPSRSTRKTCWACIFSARRR